MVVHWKSGLEAAWCPFWKRLFSLSNRFRIAFGTLNFGAPNFWIQTCCFPPAGWFIGVHNMDSAHCSWWWRLLPTIWAVKRRSFYWRFLNVSSNEASSWNQILCNGIQQTCSFRANLTEHLQNFVIRNAKHQKQQQKSKLSKLETRTSIDFKESKVNWRACRASFKLFENLKNARRLRKVNWVAKKAVWFR